MQCGICTTCFSCSVRCPRGIYPTELMETLRPIALKEGIRNKNARFNKVFEDMVRKNGRVSEFLLISKYSISEPEMIKQVPFGLALISKGKLPLSIDKMEYACELEAIFKLGEKTQKENEGQEAVFRRLGIELEEIKNWNCCGALHVDDMPTKVALSARTLVAGKGLDIATPCNLCYSNLMRANRALEDAALKDMGLPKLAEHVKHPLKIIAVPYYGCLLTRPENKFDSPENPKSLDNLISTLGAEPVKYYYKTESGWVFPGPRGFRAVRREQGLHRKRKKALLKGLLYLLAETGSACEKDER